MALGESFGPVLSGAANYKLGFTHSQEVLAMTVALFATIYLLICGDRYLFSSTQLDNQDEQKPILKEKGKYLPAAY